MKKIVSIALAIALICFMIASTAFANETAVLKVETTTTSVQQGENRLRLYRQPDTVRSICHRRGATGAALSEFDFGDNGLHRGIEVHQSEAW